mmetsp:Transcript_44008/g.71611  ORF Transcript_44008/g.71611 Transcript_44008/m.71611 type:complete len:277 (-) Transcript_44008:701-1531(-)
MGIGSKLLKKATKAITLTRKASLASKESIDAAKEKLKSVSTADIPQDIAAEIVLAQQKLISSLEKDIDQGLANEKVEQKFVSKSAEFESPPSLSPPLSPKCDSQRSDSQPPSIVSVLELDSGSEDGGTLSANASQASEEAERELLTLRSKLTELIAAQQRSEELQVKVDGLQEEVEQLKECAEKSAQALKESMTAAEKAEAMFKDSKKQLQTVLSEKEAAEKRVADLRKEVISLKERITELESNPKAFSVPKENGPHPLIVIGGYLASAAVLLFVR